MPRHGRHQCRILHAWNIGNMLVAWRAGHSSSLWQSLTRSKSPLSLQALFHSLEECLGRFLDLDSIISKCIQVGHRKVNVGAGLN